MHCLCHCLKGLSIFSNDSSTVSSKCIDLHWCAKQFTSTLFLEQNAFDNDTFHVVMPLFWSHSHVLKKFSWSYFCSSWLGVMENLSKLLVNSSVCDFLLCQSGFHSACCTSRRCFVFSTEQAAPRWSKMMISMDCSKNVCMWSPYFSHPMVGRQTMFSNLLLFILQRQDVYRLWSQFSTKSP